MVDIVAELKRVLYLHRATPGGDQRSITAVALYGGNDLCDKKTGKPLAGAPLSVLAAVRELGPLSRQFDRFILVVAGNGRLWGFENHEGFDHMYAVVRHVAQWEQ